MGRAVGDTDTCDVGCADGRDDSITVGKDVRICDVGFDDREGFGLGCAVTRTFGDGLPVLR